MCAKAWGMTRADEQEGHIQTAAAANRMGSQKNEVGARRCDDDLDGTIPWKARNSGKKNDVSTDLERRP